MASQVQVVLLACSAVDTYVTGTDSTWPGIQLEVQVRNFKSAAALAAPPGSRGAWQRED